MINIFFFFYRLWPLLLIVEDQFSHEVYLNITIHKITNLWKFEFNWSSNLRDNNERIKKKPCHMKWCFQMLDFGTSTSNSEVSKSNSWKVTSFSKTTLLHREPFDTICYTINSIAYYQVSLYANNYFEYLPIVFYAFKFYMIIFFNVN